MQFKKINLIFILLLSSIILLFSCSIGKYQCQPDLISGNPGSMINSSFDEINPVCVGEDIFYSVLAKDKNNVYQFKQTKINDNGDFLPAVEIETPMLNEPGWGTYCANSVTDNKDYFFIYSSYNKDSKKRNSDLFEIAYRSNVWTEPRILKGRINSNYYESHPAISPDGSYIVFASEQDETIGETDLFISYKNNDGSWSKPVNLGSGVNTQYKELSPYIDANGNLYFASQGYSDNNDFNIIKARRLDSIRYGDSRLLPSPINSEYDELFPMITRNYILVASDRIGGCGGFDIYQFPNCGPTYLQVIVNGEDNVSKSGIVNVFVDNETEVVTLPINYDGTAEIALPANKKYLVRYTNPCFDYYSGESDVELPCSDTSSVKVIVNFTLPKVRDEFTFEEYLVPFFVSGYYLPNTKKNLHNLRMKFSYNLIGTSDSTKYIENPGTVYDEYAPLVEKALNNAIDFIIARLAYFDSKCINKSNKLVIEVSGYADSRQISEIARYDGTMIDDDELDYHIQSGVPMSNKLLSELRAYYTAKHIQNLLYNYEEYEKHKSQIIWIIEGKGIDDTEGKDELKRRVSIKIGLRNL